MAIIDPTQTNQVFARIDGLTVVEYPVSLLHIQNRGEPLDWYVNVEFNNKPEVPEFHYAKEIPQVVDGIVKVSYQVEALDLASVLRQINPNTNTAMLGMPVTPVAIADVSPSAITRIKELTIDYVQNKLDQFAQLKGYDSLLAATSYVTSAVVQFSSEAAVAVAKRDQAWNALHTYLDAVVAGTQPVPVSLAEIDAQLPAFVWP